MLFEGRRSQLRCALAFGSTSEGRASRRRASPEGAGAKVAIRKPAQRVGFEHELCNPKVPLLTGL